MPADLRAALSPSNGKTTSHSAGKAVTVAAHVSGKPAAQLVAQIDSDNAAAGHPTTQTSEKPHVKPEAKSVKAKSKAQTPKATAHKRTHKK